MTHQKHFILFMSFILSILISNPILAKPLKVVSITEDFTSIAKSIGKEHIKTTTLVKGSRNLHDVIAKPSMVIQVRKADLLIRLGMSQDKWIDGLIHVAKNNAIFFNKLGHLNASETIIHKLEVPQGNIDGSHGDMHIEGNPHYWLNPENGKLIAKEIYNRLSKIDPPNQKSYEKNYLEFIQELNRKITIWKEESKKLQQYQFITYHKVWSYFFDAFKLKSIGELEPLPGIPPNINHLLKLQNSVLANKKKPIIITANYYPPHIAQSFAKKIEGKSVILPANVGEAGIKNYIDYFDYIFYTLNK
ncbi:hypothetical protein DID78_00885 [Candidatus Marinamargulisbacteria bacterium SCGC AG-343-D04]|nr:hypothetical protein DID78_00885 [Candidatus Marinamargulisbacteria bacterium SCGC AG-343-D04]